MIKEKLDKSLDYWRRRIFTTLWITYAGFYLCKVNLVIVLPLIAKEFGYSKIEVGAIGSSFFLLYAVGQFINGQLGDKLGARKLITMGIFFSVIMNIIFPFTATFMAMIIIWGLNGYFQSTGWAPSVKTLANWFSPAKRAKIFGLYGSSYHIGNIFAWLLSGYLLLYCGWRYVFWIPAIIFFFLGICFYLRCKNSPEDIGFPSIEESGGYKKISLPDGPNHSLNRDHHLGFAFTLKQTLGNPAIWCIGLTVFFINIVRFGFLYWIPTHMFEVQRMPISKVAFSIVVFPLAGVFGSITTGWAIDRFFKTNRVPVIVVMLFLLSIFSFSYQPLLLINSTIPSLICLALIGFTIYGSDIHLAGTMAIDYGTRKAASSTAGFVNSLGYAGAGFTALGTGWIVDKYSWDFAFYLWSGSAVIATSLIAMLWKYKPATSKYV